MTHTEVPARNDTVALTVNGDRGEIPAGWTLADLLRSHDLDPRMVVVEHNREIVHDRDALPKTPLEGGDTVEIVHFVGGG